MKKSLKIFSLFVLVQISSSCFYHKVTENEVFHPVKEYLFNEDFTFNQYFIKSSDTTNIEAWSLKEDNAKLNFIYFSGNGSNIRSAIPLFNELGSQLDVNIYSFNYSGSGLSDGSPSIKGVVEDGRFALDFFREEIKNNKLPTFVLAYSLGGYVALNLADDEIINNIILLSTFTSLKELEKYLLKEALPGIARPFIKLDVDPIIYNLNNIELVKSVKKPLLILHGKADIFVPPFMGEKLYNLSTSDHKKIALIEGADHRMVVRDLDKNKIVVQEIKKFIDELKN